MVIEGLEKIEQLENVMVFQAGTVLDSREQKTEREEQKSGNRNQSSEIVTAGGRVLGVTALGSNIKIAIENAYRAVKMLHFKGMQYRSDIGKKALKRI